MYICIYTYTHMHTSRQTKQASKQNRRAPAGRSHRAHVGGPRREAEGGPEAPGAALII